MKQGSDYPRNTALAFLLAGNPGSGKTTALFSFPDIGILDCEGNLKSGIERNPGKRFWWDNPEVLTDGKPTPIHERWTRAEALVKEFGANPEVKVIGVDGLGRMTTYLKDYIPHIASLAGEKIPVLAGQKQMTLQLWSIYENKLVEWMMMLKAMGKPVVVTCHVKVDENELSMVKEQRVDIQGRLSASFAKCFTDFYMLKAEPSSDAKYKESGGVRYYIRTAPTSRIELKSHNNKVIPAEMELGDGAWVALIKSLTPQPVQEVAK